MNSTLFEMTADEIGALLEPLAVAAEDADAFERLMHALGMPTTTTLETADRDALIAAFGAAIGVKNQIEQLASESSPSLASIAALFDTLRQALTAIRAIDDLSDAMNAFAAFGEDLCCYLLANHLRLRHPLAHSMAVLATLIDPAEQLEPRPITVEDGQLTRESFRLDRFNLQRLVDLFRDPVATFRAEYGDSLLTVADANQLAGKLFPRLVRLLRVLGVPCRYGFDPDQAEQLGDAAPLLEHALIIYADDMLAGATAESGVVLNISSADRGDLGLVVSPFGALTTTKEVGDWAVELSCTAGVDVLAYGRHGLTLLADASTSEVKGGITATLPAPEEGPAYVLGAPTGTRLEVGGAQLKLDASLSEAQQSLALSADVSKAAIVIAPPDDDGFLSSILPAEGVRADFDLGLAWSNTHGLTLRGSAGLEATIPIGKSFAGIKLNTLNLSLRAQDARIDTEVSAGLSASFGPVQASVERIGLAAALSFPETGGNLGVADLDFRFKPPSGIGLAIDASAVVGGGYLFLDTQKGEYSGVLQLEIAEKIAVKAFGLLTTRLPDGAKGFSLIVFITAEDFQPIPLGMGFKLQGIGGMFAINRTFSEAALREGLRNNTLATLLFPNDPIRNAPQILRNLATVFPARLGSYLFGPMARIGWASPTLIQMDLALIMEIGARRRLLVLGRISSILPSRDKDLIRLNMDAMGILDFDVGTISLDAVLVDSRLLQKFVLTGSMAMRACMVPGPQAGFALAVGGMNPHFSPPESMPKLDRITISLASGDNPRFTCEAYFALTSNTIQFGSRASMYAAAFGFSVEGEVGFDVLIQLLPFHFLAEYYASIQLKRGSRNLFKVKVEGALEGPRPLRISAKATFEILWCDFSIRFDKTLIQGETPPLPNAVSAWDELLRSLGARDSWSAETSAGRKHGVVLRKLPANAPLAVDPLGDLAVRQSVLPLNTSRDLDTFGGAPISGAKRFAITAATLNGDVQPMRVAKDLFAPAQFFDLSDEEKLASPSFEEMGSGVGFGSDAMFLEESIDHRAEAALTYESIIIDAHGGASGTPTTSYELRGDRLRRQARFAAVAKAPIRHAGLARFRNENLVPAVALATPRWMIASKSDLNVLAPVLNAGASWGAARAALRELHRAEPVDAARWQLVPTYDVAV